MAGKNENENISGPGFTTIKPAAIDLTAASVTEKEKETSGRFNKRSWLWLSLGGLLLTGAIVVFLLPLRLPPAATDPSAIGAGPAVTEKSQSQGSRQPVKTQTGTAESPWKKAQQSELRRETQDILAQMLDAQRTLGGEGVRVWAEKEYDQAIQHAEAGDAEYGRQNFAQARDQYARALDIFTRLLEGIDGLFEKTMATGNAALFEGDPERAREAFKVALAIDPLDRAALLGMRRAETLDEVTTLINQGDALLQAGKLEDAKTTYQQALDIDNHSRRAKQQLQLSEDKLSDRKFNLAMSSGFGFLEKGQHKQAQTAFSKALELKPKSRDARSGLEQARHRITSANIDSLLKQAKKLEAIEDWQGALSKYEAALSLNSNLANAIEGRERTTTRNEIHNRLEQILTVHSARLFDPAGFNEATGFYNKILSISEPGPVLTEQLTKLSRLLDKADTPVQVQLKSDNLTKVILYKVGELGYFTSKDLSLRPGSYVAVGHRDGYRDARVEFFVDPDKSMQPVVIQSNEKIAL